MDAAVSTNSVRAVIFDLDGTLTRPQLDFDQIRAEIGLSTTSRTPILESLEDMDEASRARAWAILERHELAAAQASEMHEGAWDVIEAIRSQNIRVGILTRNSRACTKMVIDRHRLELDWIHTREDGPVKPAPDAIVAMCRRWDVALHRTFMVGDYLFDIQAGRAAGTRTVLMIGDGPEPEYAKEADHVIRRLTEMLPLIKVG